MIMFVCHLVLYLIWKIPAVYEKRHRPDGGQIPLYVTGDVGDWLGLSLVSLAFYFVAVVPWQLLVLCVVPACFVTFCLHKYWRRVSVGQIVSLYTPSGKLTWAGRLHLPYIVFVATTSLALAVSLGTLAAPAIGLFIAGWTMYLCTVLVDRWRGVI